MARWKVASQESGCSLLVFIKSKMDSSIASRQIKKAIDAGRCRLNGKTERFSSKLVGFGDNVEFDGIEATTSLPQKMVVSSEEILFVDEDLLAYNKPAGISSEDPNLLSALKALVSNLALLHRLDRETSGVLLFARNPKAEKALLTSFKQRKIKKTYFAIVDAIPSKPTGVIEDFLGKLHVYQGQTLWGEVSLEKGGVFARTVWELKCSGKEVSLVVCYPETGRTHQIRVHLSGIGHPILGDHQYGRAFRSRYQAPRIMLHAADVEFDHPRTNQKITISAPLPNDFKVVLSLIENLSL